MATLKYYKVINLIEKIIESYIRRFEKLKYSVLAAVKSIRIDKKRNNSAFFGFIHKKGSKAAELKVRKLSELFKNEALYNSILYVCSGNVPLSYCLKEKKRGVKVILNQNGVYYKAWYGPDYIKANENELAGYYRIADYIIYQSKFAEKSAKKFLGDPICPSTVLYNPVDTSLFLPNSKRSFNPFSPIFIATGNFYSKSKAHRLHLLLQSFEIMRKKLPMSKLIIAGKISSDLDHIKFVKAKNVYFKGFYTYSQAPKIYQEGDIYLSTQFNDTCPSAVLESMACGLPVVYLNCGGTPELVEDAGIGLIVENSWDRYNYPTAENYAYAMMRAIENRKELSQLARNRTITMFDTQKWKTRHEEIFSSVCE